LELKDWGLEHQELWQKIISVIESHQHFLLTSHINPDGDALGSELALAEHLESLGKKVTVINSDPVPAVYQFLDREQKIRRFSSKRHAALIARIEVIIVLDASGGWSRIGSIGQVLEQSQAIKLCIDHHPDWHPFADLAVIDTEAAATGELIYSLIRTMGGVITKDMAESLYTAILTDTGSFRFPKTRPQTHCITAELIATGADPLYIYHQLYERNSLGLVRLKGYVMNSIRTTAGGQVAYYSLSQKTMEEYKVRSSELDGVASLGQQIDNVRISIFCMETANGQVKVSLRSDGTVAVNQIAIQYGGGGHSSAAGAIIAGQLQPVMNELVAKLVALLAWKNENEC
jgi:phosphoesterase RecJ-like protein